MKLIIQKLSVLTLVLTVLFTTALPAQAELSSENKETLKEIMANNPNDLLAIMTYLYSLMYQGTSLPGTTTGTKTTETPSTTTTETPQNNAQLCTYAKGITKNLSRGMNDPQVKTLQKFLNALAVQDTNYKAVIASGDGSYGNETTYFGSGTQNAVKVLQGRLRVLQSGMVGPLTRAAMVKKVCGTSTTTGTRTPTSTGTLPQATTNSGGSDTSTTPDSSAATGGLSLSIEPLAGASAQNVFALTSSGQKVGQVCSLRLYRTYAAGLSNPTMLAQAKLPETYGLYWEEYIHEGRSSRQTSDKNGLISYMKVKEDVAFRSECNDGTNSNMVTASVTAGGSGDPADTLELSSGEKVEILQKTEGEISRSPNKTYTVSGVAYGLRRLEVKFTGLHGFSSCDIGLSDATSVGEGKAWSCSRDTEDLGPGNVTVDFLGMKSSQNSNEEVSLGKYSFVVNRYAGDTKYD